MVVNFGNISTKFCRLEAPGGREQSLFAPSLSSRSWWSWKCRVWGEGVKLCEQEPPIPHLLISWSPDPEVIVLTCVNRSLLSSISWSPDHDESVECEVKVLTCVNRSLLSSIWRGLIRGISGECSETGVNMSLRVQPPPNWWIQSHHSIIFASPVPL